VAQHPFLDGNPAGSASGSAMTSIKRVYVSNDSTNLYVRVDNASGSLSAYNTSPDFAILIYAQTSTTRARSIRPRQGFTEEHSIIR